MKGIAVRTLGVAMGLTLAAPAIANDWPQWRGLDRSGEWREDGIIERFPEDGLEVVWRTPINGGYSGPSVADGRVFITDWRPKEGSRIKEGFERALALSEETGEILWTHEWEVGYAPLQASYAIGPRATPTVDGNRVYVAGAVGHVLAFEAATGKVIWSYDSVEEGNASVAIWGFASSPLIHGDMLIAVVGAEPDGKVMAFDKHTGEEKWRALSSNWEPGYGQPILVERGGVEQLIIWEPQAVNSLDPQTGEVYWSVPWEGASSLTVATPVVHGNRMLLTQFYRGSLLLEFEEEKPGVREIWRGQGRSELPDRTEGLHSLITTPIFEGDTIYGVCSYGELRGLNAADGARLWVTDEMTRQGRWGAAFMVKHGDRWFVNNDEGYLIIARFSRDGYEEIDRARLLKPTANAGFGPQRFGEAMVNWSHPAYANRHIVARNDEEIIRVSLAAE